MRTFVARIEHIYAWECPYCGELCEDHSDPLGKIVACEHCGEEAECQEVDLDEQNHI